MPSAPDRTSAFSRRRLSGDEFTVEPGSPLIGLSLAEADLHAKIGLTRIAIKEPEAEDFSYNPAPTKIIEVGTMMIAVGTPDQAAKLRRLCER
ncbi:MAG: hypothetical protein JRC92_09620 [Deltaproteobacteria bacterium]|nr:hypothetical protein [Deltaproteobacteria bacterium]